MSGQRVSVIIPAYKSAGTICRAVDSVLAQTHSAHEVIVVDDGSPDDQAAVVERTYGERVILIRQPNGKTAKARNTGIERATGDFIAFLDADDYWEPHKLEQQLAVFAKHPEVGLVAGRWLEEEPGQARAIAQRPYDPRDFDRPRVEQGPRAFQLGTRIWTGSLLVRRDVLGSERFESGLEPAEDRDLWIRLAANHAVYLMSEPLATAVLETGSISRTNLERDCTNMLRVVDRNRVLLGTAGSRIWRSYVMFRWAAIDSQPATALPRLIRSLWLWPLPYREIDAVVPFGRLKRLMTLIGSMGRGGQPNGAAST